MRTIETATFYGLLLVIGLFIGGIGAFLFRHGHELEAVVFLVASASVAGFVIGAREAGRRHAPTPPEEACAAEGAPVVMLRRRV